MKELLIKELSAKLDDKEYMDGIKTISIIHDTEYRLDFSVYFDDLVCMGGYVASVNNGVEGSTLEEYTNFIKKIMSLQNVLVFQFYDEELPEIWKESYRNADIPEEKWGRRVEFYKYNDMNEMFCVDWLDYMQIIGEIEDVPDWKKLVVEWYRSKLINSFDEGD